MSRSAAGVQLPEPEGHAHSQTHKHRQHTQPSEDLDFSHDRLSLHQTVAVQEVHICTKISMLTDNNAKELT